MDISKVGRPLSSPILISMVWHMLSKYHFAMHPVHGGCVTVAFVEEMTQAAKRY